MPRLIPVTDPADPCLDPFRAVRERDLVGRDGQFIAEGAVVLSVLAGQDRHETLSVLIAANRLSGVMPILARLPADVPVHIVPPAAIEAIAGFPIHRGILAIGRRAALPTPAALLQHLPARALVLVMIGIANHDNVGGLFRNAAAFGAAVLIDSACPDPLYRKALRVSVGGVLRVPYAVLATGQDPVDLLARHNVTAFALSPSGATPLHRVVRPPRAAVIVGAEGAGLPASLLARTETLAIPMAAGFDSLNVATAAGIALHHLAVQPGPADQSGSNSVT